MDQIAPAPMLGTDAGTRRRKRLAVMAMLLAVVIYGSNFVVSRHALLNGLNTHDLIALRFAIAGPLLLPVFLRRGLSSCGGVGWRRGFWLTLSSGFPMPYLMFMGLALAPAAHGATIGPGVVTLTGIVGSVVLFGAALTGRLVTGIAGVLAGLACLGIAGSAGATAMTLRGDLFFLSVGLLWGFYPLMVQLWRIDGLIATAIVSVLSLIYLPVYFLFYFRGFDIAPWWVLALHGINQGVLNVIVGLWAWGWAAHVLGPGVVGRFPPLIPVTGTLLAIPVLGEIPSSLQLAGVMLIIAGLVVASWRRPALRPARPAASLLASRR
ncbi:DMT family transporter [Bosea sp. (in: a-proteobacteria)]|uniref:DMT family transporter n=1 Tax=Bosea sp. (in: a-proteobacteria) TaxID=1871050 RepID=UPI0026379BBE|nr:DMT family transporter [Bosea sp. (in: a-proteobacteria)]MCO5093079.1 DMT family transporter [Bosea sp. (in: a-proteobacteria)]